MSNVKPIPDGYHTITPYIIVDDVAKLIKFLEHAFDAKTIFAIQGPNGTIPHAELKIGNSMLMVGMAKAEHKAMPCALYVYFPDTDVTYKKALKAGAESLMEPMDMFYGDRNAGVKDFAGNQWWIGTHIEDVAPDELRKRAEEFYSKQ